MKVAIMGAGMSGLSCAITLEKHGIEPVIFEKRNTVGDRFVNAEGFFNILNRPINNCLEYLQDKYEIHLKPISPINEIKFHSKNEVSGITSNLGSINIRGRHENSFEKQLASQVKSKIVFNSTLEYEQLKKDFSHVVLATGDGAYASKLNNYRCDLTCTLKGATVEGSFLADVVNVWFNYQFAPKGYAYMIPFSEKEAHIVMAYPDYEENIKRDIDEMWQRFYDQLKKDFNQELKITDRFEVTRYMIGISNKPKIENTYFVGNCFGAISPALGFGQFIAILTGIYAAQDICGVGSYEQLVKPLYENYNNSLIIRRTLEKLDDNKLDKVIKSFDNKLLDKAIDYVYGDETKFDFLKWLSYIIKPWI